MESFEDSSAVLAKFEIKFKDNEKNIHLLIKDDEFLRNLRYISVCLNNTENNSFQWDLLDEFNLFQILTKLLEYYFNTLKENEDDDRTFRPLTDLLEIIYKISHRSLKFVAKFINLNMLEMFIHLVQNLRLIEFLFEAFLNVLSKMLNIFYYISKTQLHIMDQNFSLTSEHFNILRNARDLIEKLSLDDERDGLQGKPVLKLFVTCLSYLQVRFRPNDSLVSLNLFRVFENGYIHSNFRNISGEFLLNCELIEYEFPNENNELEFQKVHKLNISDNKKSYETILRTFEQIINNISILCFDNEKKIVGYEFYKFFIKSLIIFGLDIEKLLGLKCLNDFLVVEEVKKDLNEDEPFIETLKNMRTNKNSVCNNQMQQRLNIMIQKTLALIFN
jgi:hypothetical protein